MGASFEFSVDLIRRLVRVRMSGLFDEQTMREWCVAYRERGTKPHRGQTHMVVADMRGMKTVHPTIAALMGQEIGYARQNGVVLCAHISDDTMQRLQVARVARQSSPHDDATIEVATPEEAERVIESHHQIIYDPRLLESIRASLSR